MTSKPAIINGIHQRLKRNYDELNKLSNDELQKYYLSHVFKYYIEYYAGIREVKEAQQKAFQDISKHLETMGTEMGGSNNERDKINERLTKLVKELEVLPQAGGALNIKI